MFEGCVVVGKVVNVVNRELLERQMSANELNSLQNKIDKQLEHRSVAREPEKVARIEEKVSWMQRKLQSLVKAHHNTLFHREVTGPLLEHDDSTATVLVIDWGHKHMGYAPLGADKVPCPMPGEYVACRLRELEIVSLPMGHSVYERHNEARLEYIRPIKLHEIEEDHLSIQSDVKDDVLTHVYFEDSLSPPQSSVYIDQCYTDLFNDNDHEIFSQIRDIYNTECSLTQSEDNVIAGKMRVDIHSESTSDIHAAVHMINDKIRMHEAKKAIDSSDIPDDEFVKLETQVTSTPTTQDYLTEETISDDLFNSSDIITQSEDPSISGITLVPLPDHQHVFVKKEDLPVELRNTNTLDVYIDNLYTGLTIGKGVSHLKQIRVKTGVYVKCEFDDEKLINGKRLYSLQAENKDSLLLAISMINSRIAKRKS